MILTTRFTTALVDSRRLANNVDPPRIGLRSSEEGEAGIDVGIPVRFVGRCWIFHLQGSSLSLSLSLLIFWTELIR